MTTSYDKTAKVWDVNGKLIANCIGHLSGVVSADFTKCGNKIITASWDNTVKIWDLRGAEVPSFHSIDKVVLSKDGNKQLTTVETTVNILDLDGNTLAVCSNHQDTIIGADFSFDNKKIITVSTDKTIRQWNLKGKEIANNKINEIKSIFFSPYSEHVAGVLLINNIVKIWNYNGKQITELRGHTDAINMVEFSSDGKILTASNDKTAKLWDFNGKLLVTFDKHTHWVNSAKFSPDGNKIVTASTDTSAKLWDITGNELKSMDTHYLGVVYADFAPDNSKIITTSQDNTAILWDSEGNELLALRGHLNFVYFAIFASDSKHILTTSWDSSAKLWDLSGNELASYNNHTNVLTSAVFTPCGKKILTSSWDKTIKLWLTHKGMYDWLLEADIPQLTNTDKEEIGLKK